LETAINYATQFEILQRIEDLYSQISRITAQIDFEKENHEQILNERQKLLDEITSLQKLFGNLEPGASAEKINAIEERIKVLLMGILSDSEMLLERSQVLQDSIKEELSKITITSNAAKSYAAYK
jgi:uncharacterized protein YoxC